MTTDAAFRLGPPCPRCGRQELGDFGVLLCSVCAWSRFNEYFNAKSAAEKAMVQAKFAKMIDDPVPIILERQ